MRTWHDPETKHERVGGTYGPWVHEADKMQWVDQDSGLDCLIVRGPLGALCGYVGVGPEHPWHGRGYADLDVSVHGGLTYANACEGDEHDATAICHVPEPGRPEHVWWFGFDCNHGGDYVPTLAAHHQQLGRGGPSVITDAPYRDITYVQRECADLARQLADIHSA